MNKKVYKWFWAWQADEEEAWLAEMARQGHALTGVGYAAYEFEPCAPGAYIVRLELLDALPCTARGRDYIEFVESTGAEYLGSVLRWAYFRKKADEGGFDLFSDLDSRIRHLERIHWLLVPLTVMLAVNLCNVAAMLAHFPQEMLLRAGAAVEILLLYLFLRGLRTIRRKRNALAAERTLHE